MLFTVSVTHREGALLFLAIKEVIGVAMFRKYTYRNSPRAPALSIKFFAVLLSSITILITVLFINYDRFGRLHVHIPVHKIAIITLDPK